MPSLKPEAATTIPPTHSSFPLQSSLSPAPSGLATYLALPGEQDDAVLQGAVAHFLPALPDQLLIPAGKSVALHFLRDREQRRFGRKLRSPPKGSRAALGVTGGPDPNPNPRAKTTNNKQQNPLAGLDGALRAVLLARSFSSHLWNGLASFLFFFLPFFFRAPLRWEEEESLQPCPEKEPERSGETPCCFSEPPRGREDPRSRASSPGSS